MRIYCLPYFLQYCKKLSTADMRCTFCTQCSIVLTILNCLVINGVYKNRAKDVCVSETVSPTMKLTFYVVFSLFLLTTWKKSDNKSNVTEIAYFRSSRSNAFRDDNLYIHDGHCLVTNCLNTAKSRVKWITKIPQSHTQFVFHDFPITAL
ncbi:uncharacterized protein DEA37_0008356 [Paragonimus westermani]|uniref:Uncharacterized protein n=1 Tax=Paragonimus westermani TaxID=34504 RepID=A0A5J4NCB3_9TREM|nr:uncharacterized protein DEA37_0008356 [Paragonimus westermani]